MPLFGLRICFSSQLDPLVEAEHACAGAGHEVGPRSRSAEDAEGAEQAVHLEAARERGEQVGACKAASDLQQHFPLLAARRDERASHVDAVHQGHQDYRDHGVAQEVQELRHKQEHPKAHAIPRVDQQVQREEPDAGPEECGTSEENGTDIVVGLSPVNHSEGGGKHGRQHHCKQGKCEVALEQALIRAGEVLLQVATGVGELHNVLRVDGLAAPRDDGGYVLAVHRRLDVERQVVCDNLLGAFAERLDDLGPLHQVVAGETLLQLCVVQDEELVAVRGDNCLRVNVPVWHALALCWLGESKAEG
mmetsp:Transcript_88006/g.249327  ORF Transcript_88006/g.249327 Transcript_88006/m.249327 type:complete len:305 (-) Transcript_88006:173-1087(-)